MKPLYVPCSYCKNNKKKYNCCSSSLSAKTSSETKTKIRSCGNNKEATILHRFSVERRIKLTSLYYFAIIASRDNQYHSLINLCWKSFILSLVNVIKGDNGISSGDEERGK